MPNGPRDTGPIKMVNGPKPEKRVWNTQGHYKKLHFRGLAEKRGREEGTPDINALQFVNGRPENIPTKPAVTTSETSMYSNPYGRRESGRNRALEVKSEDEAHDAVHAIALQSYEQAKIPMTCYEWKSGSCQYAGEENICPMYHAR